jgi:hypothetical protein
MTSDADAVFAAIVRLGTGPEGRAEIPMDELAPHVDSGGDPTTAFGPLMAALAELADAGQVDVWQRRDGSVGVILTSLSAAQLRLRLMPDSSRWVADKQRVRSVRRSIRLLVCETDLSDDDYIPLDQIADPRQREAIDDAMMYERMVAMRAESLTRRAQRKIDRHKPPEIFMMGVLCHPLPGQDRGPWAPRAEPTPADLARGMVLKPPANSTCYACKGLPLRPGYGCICSRWANEDEIPEAERDAARREVDAAWAARVRARGKGRQAAQQVAVEVEPAGPEPDRSADLSLAMGLTLGGGVAAGKRGKGAAR